MDTLKAQRLDETAKKKLPTWGSKHRDIKSRKILHVMEQFGPDSIAETSWVDVGCGSGGIAVALAPHVKEILGVDPESWPLWQEYAASHGNLQFVQRSIENLSLPNACADVVICNQVYEHVPDPEYLVAEIHRILKPGGYCYFAGPNLLFPIEPHVFWPFVHWLPRRFAVRLMRLFGAKKIIDANSVSYWTLTRWFTRFEVTDALPEIITHPDRYELPGRLVRIFSNLPRWAISSLTWLSPAFIFVLRKPRATDKATKLQ
jgi:2-polyprenyl-3-methyl-5-hydroxy-6-metoxy-1,4-benzoquinol methylase